MDFCWGSVSPEFHEKWEFICFLFIKRGVSGSHQLHDIRGINLKQMRTIISEITLICIARIAVPVKLNIQRWPDISGEVYFFRDVT
jgi:hypothetical protein